MRRERRLKLQAVELCRRRGHDIGVFKRHDFSRRASYAHCRRCNMQVVVNTAPSPNGVDIGGEAVALGCDPNLSRWNQNGSLKHEA